MTLKLSSCEIEVKCLSTYTDIYSSRGGYHCTVKNANSTDEMAAQLESKFKIYKSSYNPIQTIEFVSSNIADGFPVTFESFVLLSQLKASGVGMKTLSGSFLKGHATFKLIDLSKNELTEILPNTFVKIAITVLNLSFNKISKIDELAFNGSTINKLDLSNNLLKSIDFIQHMNIYGMLDFSQNLLEQVNINIKKNQDLDARMAITMMLQGLSSNSLIINENKNLKKVDCNTELKFGSVQLRENPQLRDVNLNNCTIERFDVSGSKKLDKIELNENIQTFIAENTKSVSIDFSKSKSLKTLQLSNADISLDVLNKSLSVESLEELDLSNNYIGPVNISTFALLKNLSTLNLKATKLSGITYGTFSHQDKVERLNIADNDLGFIDLNMMFSMSNLLRLDISGNGLQDLDSIDQAHHLFALLQTIDITKNRFTCKTLMKLVRIFKTYKVALVKSNIEHHETNIHGIVCFHVDGDDDGIKPDLDNSSNLAEISAKINIISEKINKNSETIKILMMNNQSPKASALVNTKPMEVQNSTLMESSLIIVCICFAIFMGMKIYITARNNFGSSGRHGRPLLSQSLSAMCADDI